jgi:hypothetical protein
MLASSIPSPRPVIASDRTICRGDDDHQIAFFALHSANAWRPLDPSDDTHQIQPKRDFAADSLQISKWTVFEAIDSCGSRAELGGAKAFAFLLT